MLQGEIVGLAIAKTGNNPADQNILTIFDNYFPIGVKILVGSYAWSFCTSILPVTPSLDITPTYKYTYALPNDYGRLLNAMSAESQALPDRFTPVPYNIIDGNLVSNDLIKYIVVSNYAAINGNYPELFGECLSSWIGMQYALSVIKPDLYAMLQRQYNDQYKNALEADTANQSPLYLRGSYLENKLGGTTGFVGWQGFSNE